MNHKAAGRTLRSSSLKQSRAVLADDNRSDALLASEVMCVDKEGQLPRRPTSLNNADDTCVRRLQVPPDVYAEVSCDTMAVASR